ncbi:MULTISPECIES: type IX secretion system membrane protein PorP/SprF [Winogradskyella]|uniref:PorP/SprF family type IX secretion system membrane protein n=1 Tax=Winogradskyella TaxID=286104 RepID=UPI0015CAB2BF|nr:MULTISPECIES: type IX secretion system membrane protein PorP/SprF [Winogradskyella]QXP77960.1 type IX secretion system membrane protein PorP/SprF [Winogradskyella sp. HaHa_3_26]
MTNKITYSIAIIISLLSFSLHAQQDPQFTQYMYNMSVVNPAYALDDDTNINLGILYRSQWVGSVGGPTTGTFFGHTKLTDQLEGGISIVHDEIGDVVKQTSAYADVAYVLPIGLNSKLSFGIKAGATFFSTNFDGFTYSDQVNEDPAFSENINRTFPNIGAGLYYFSEKYYVGLSAPNLLQSKHLKDESGVVSEASENVHLFFTGGYVFNLNENLKFKPAFMTKYVNSAPISVDLTANILMYDKLEFGAGYRYDDSVTGMINFSISSAIRIGYAYDYTLTNLGEFNSGSHEVFLLFNIEKFGKGYDKSPRFF